MAPSSVQGSRTVTQLSHLSEERQFVLRNDTDEEAEAERRDRSGYRDDDDDGDDMEWEGTPPLDR